MTRLRSILALALCMGICLITGFLGSIATASSVRSWYPRIERPPWTPPDAVFAPVWTTLFVLMGVAVWLVWLRSDERPVGRALLWFATQLALNGVWSFLFFGLRRPDLALVEILLLLVAIVGTIVAFARIRPVAAWLLAPYLAWVAFASALNGAIWWLNRGG